MARKLLTVGLSLGVLGCLMLLPAGGGADRPVQGPPLSATGLLSGFAQQNGLATAASAQKVADVSSRDDGGGVLAPAFAGATDIKVNQDFSRRPQNETTIAVNPWSPNMLVAGANDYRLGAPIAAAFYTSFDNGFSWTDGIPPYPLLVGINNNGSSFTEPPFGAGDPVVAFGKARAGDPEIFAGTPVAYLAYLGVSSSNCEHGIFLSRSTNGLTWTRPVVPPLLPPKGLFTPVYWDKAQDCRNFNDKPWLAVDTSGGPHDGRVYVTWTRFTYSRGNFLESPILLAYSDDNGQNWSNPMLVTGNSLSLCSYQSSGSAGPCDESQFSSLAVGRDGSVYVGFINQQGSGAAQGLRNQYLVTKLNPDTFALTGPNRVANLIDGASDLPLNGLGQQTLCNSNFRLNSAGNLAVDPSDATGKTAYVVFADNRNGSAFPAPTYVTQSPADSFTCPAGSMTDDDIFVMKTTDGGITWRNPATSTSTPLRVNQDTLNNDKDQWFPFAAVSSGGRVDVMYYDRRDDSFNRFAHVYLARSTDGGATWTEVRITNTFSNLNWAFESGFFIGDYNGLAIAPDGTSYPLWTDSRNGTPSVRQSDVMVDIVGP